MTSAPSILTPLLAQRPDFDLPDLALYGVILLITVIGGIIQKIKKGSEKGKGPESGQQPAGPRPTARVPDLAPPDRPRRRAAASPGPARTGRTLRPPVQARPPTPRPQHPPRPEQPQRPQPSVVGTPATYTPEQLRWLIEQRRQAEQPTEAPVETIEVEPVEPTPKPPASARPAAADLSSDLRRLLGDRGGLRTGFVLTEILAPPLALRDDQR